MKRRIKTAEEQDVHTGWRRLFVWTSRAGATSRVKRRTRRRERREGKRETRMDSLPPDDEFLAWLDIRMSERYWLKEGTVEGCEGGDSGQQSSPSTGRTE